MPAPSPSLLAALDDACVDGPIDVVLGPSNPFLSLGPILDIPGMLGELRKKARRVVAVSPIIGGRALKGPAAKIMSELGLPASAPGWTQRLAQRYPEFVDTWVWDDADRELVATVPDSYDVRVTATVMSEPGVGQGLPCGCSRYAALHLEAVIALKTRSDAKRRLSADLTDEARESLVEAMALDVIAALSASPAITAVHVICGDGWAQLEKLPAPVRVCGSPMSTAGDW